MSCVDREEPRNLTEKVTETGVLVDVLKNRLNALVVCLSNSWGGLEQVAVGDALDIGHLGLDVKMLCLEGSPIHENLAKRKEVQVVPVSFKPKNFFDLKLRAELNRLIQSGINLIHTHQPSLLPSIVPWIWRKPEISMLATRHIMNNHNKRNFFHAALYSRLDALIVMSNTLRQNVLETHAIPEHRVKVINLGLDFTRFDPARVDSLRQRTLWGADPETVVIGLVGRIDPAKGQGTFIKAAAGLLKNQKSKEKLKFVLVGEETLGGPGSHLEELKEMVSQFRLDEHVVFAGYHENIPEVMHALDIFVMPSRQEAFGLVAIEAMAMERPIVISRGGSAEEIVSDQTFGLLVRAEDAFDLQRKLRVLLDKPDDRLMMGKKGRQHVLRNYDRMMRVRKTLEIYDRSLRKRGVT